MSKATIAILGLNGFLGKPILDAIDSGVFDDKISYPIKAITRKEPEVKHDKIEYIIADISDSNSIDSLVEKLGSIDSFVELVGVNPTIYSNVETLLSKLKPKLFIPSQFGTDIIAVDAYAPGFLSLKTKHSEAVRNLGIKVVDVITSLFAAPGSFVYESIGSIGGNTNDKTVSLIGDINQKFHISKLEDIGYSVVSLASNPNPQSLPDTVRIASDLITPQIVIDTYSKNHDNVELKIISETSAEDARKQFIDGLATTGFEPSKFIWYIQVIVAQGLDQGLYFSKLDNELVNPGESLWKWSKF